jgi:DNA topoisomerase-6 subunit A
MSETDPRITLLRSIGEDIITSIEDQQFPILELSDRSTDNIRYDSDLKCFKLGNSKVVRDSSNLRHVNSFSKLLWVASYTKRLLETGRTSSLRDLYYSSEAFGVDFKDQSESDRIVSDLECLTGLSREDLGIFPEEHSSIFGEVTMQYTVPGYEGKEIELTTSPDGLPIGPALMTADLVGTDASLVLAVESGGMFSRLIETGCWKRFKAVLVHLGGQAPRSTRSLLRRLHNDLNLPIYIFTDGDPWGLHIARVIMAGSANAAHISDLAVPAAEWIGVSADDIEKYHLPADKMSDSDLKRLDELILDPRYQTEYWQDHIMKFKKLRRKAEQQAFSRHGMDFVVDSYLPDKISSATS